MLLALTMIVVSSPIWALDYPADPVKYMLEVRDSVATGDYRKTADGTVQIFADGKAVSIYTVDYRRRNRADALNSAFWPFNTALQNRLRKDGMYPAYYRLRREYIDARPSWWTTTVAKPITDRLKLIW